MFTSKVNNKAKKESHPQYIFYIYSDLNAELFKGTNIINRILMYLFISNDFGYCFTWWYHQNISNNIPFYTPSI